MVTANDNIETLLISESMALSIVSMFVNDITGIDGDGIVAVYLIGSLGGGYYRPGQSDIDTIIITKDQATIKQEQIDKVASDYWHRFNIPKGFGSIMIHEIELYPPYDRSKVEDFSFSVEIARLKVQGKQFYQSYALSQVPMPNREDLIVDARIMQNWLNKEFGYPMFDKLRTTGCINCILGSMRDFLMIDKGIFEFNKFKTIECYLKNAPPIYDLDLFREIVYYLKGQTTGEQLLLEKLQRFGINLRDYLNKYLLNLDFC